MSKPALQFEKISFTYPPSKGSDEKVIFDNLDFQVNTGEFVCIIGPSGSGKTTLFKLVTGLMQPTIGSILLNGENEEKRLGKVGYMPQQDLLMPWRTIMDNAALPLEIKGIPKKEAQTQVRQLLDEFGLTGVENKYPSDLSGGMRQRVSFLRTVLSGSNVLLLDEPFSSLDAITRLNMQEWLLNQWEKYKSTVLFITHDVDEALFLADRVFVFTEAPIQQFYELKVPLERPRQLKDIHKTKVIELKEYLIDQLRSRVLP
ncbi:ABC transporter ATP-binding protein [Evansella sp. AB-rgal1]|uniref:ABC transporter ATP-binding protein n=1 Tax=Evansella sp. AB-rgal1 TaxID=3242696 RepID=UPI00359E32DE